MQHLRDLDMEKATVESWQQAVEYFLASEKRRERFASATRRQRVPQRRNKSVSALSADGDGGIDAAERFLRAAVENVLSDHGQHVVHRHNQVELAALCSDAPFSSAVLPLSLSTKAGRAVFASTAWESGTQLTMRSCGCVVEASSAGSSWKCGSCADLIQQRVESALPTVFIPGDLWRDIGEPLQQDGLEEVVSAGKSDLEFLRECAGSGKLLPSQSGCVHARCLLQCPSRV